MHEPLKEKGIYNIFEYIILNSLNKFVTLCPVNNHFFFLIHFLKMTSLTEFWELSRICHIQHLVRHLILFKLKCLNSIRLVKYTSQNYTREFVTWEIFFVWLFFQVTTWSICRTAKRSTTKICFPEASSVSNQSGL